MMRKSWVRAAILGAALLWGCEPQTPEEIGNVEGCASGYYDAGNEVFEFSYAKNEGLYATDPEYRKGWDEGYKECYEQEMRTPRMMLP